MRDLGWVAHFFYYFTERSFLELRVLLLYRYNPLSSDQSP